MTWIVVSTPLDAKHSLQLKLLAQDHSPLSYLQVLDLWRSDPLFCAWFNQQLAEAPYGAFRWETPPITPQTATRPFECVLIANPGLAREPEPAAFAAHFDPRALAVAFWNLGRDAMMVVPCPRGPHDHYGHLAAFVRGAPPEQIHALWARVGVEAGRRLSSQRPLWISTAGAGVSWLHVRLDDHPKYYGHKPYRTVS